MPVLESHLEARIWQRFNYFRLKFYRFFLCHIHLVNSIFIGRENAGAISRNGDRVLEMGR
jgi:hypothetical protein